MEKKKKNRLTVIILAIIAVIIIFAPLFLRNSAEFGGSEYVFYCSTCF